jgi:hypothetical protein
MTDALSTYSEVFSAKGFGNVIPPDACSVPEAVQESGAFGTWLNASRRELSSQEGVCMSERKGTSARHLKFIGLFRKVEPSLGARR